MDGAVDTPFICLRVSKNRNNIQRSSGSIFFIVMSFPLKDCSLLLGHSSREQGCSPFSFYALTQLLWRIIFAFSQESYDEDALKIQEPFVQGAFFLC